MAIFVYGMQKFSIPSYLFSFNSWQPIAQKRKAWQITNMIPIKANDEDWILRLKAFFSTQHFWHLKAKLPFTWNRVLSPSLISKKLRCELHKIPQIRTICSPTKLRHIFACNLPIPPTHQNLHTTNPGRMQITYLWVACCQLFWLEFWMANQAGSFCVDYFLDLFIIPPLPII